MNKFKKSLYFNNGKAFSRYKCIFNVFISESLYKNNVTSNFNNFLNKIDYMYV